MRVWFWFTHNWWGHHDAILQPDVLQVWPYRDTVIWTQTKEHSFFNVKGISHLVCVNARCLQKRIPKKYFKGIFTCKRINRVIPKVTLSSPCRWGLLSPPLSPHSLSGIRKVRKFYWISISAFNAQSSRVIIVVVVQVGAVEIYVA